MTKQPAVVNFAPERHSVELRDVELPEPGDDDVLVRVGAVGVCGSDLHQWQAAHSWPVNYPVVLGHEFAGVVEQSGARAEQWKPGTRVVSETAAVIDAASPLSRTGRYNLDPTRLGFGYGVNGAMTELVRVPARCLHHVPDELPIEHAALCEPCCVALQTVVENSHVKPGDRIVVLGPGPIGLLCGAVAALCGAEVAVVGLERDATRLAIAEKLGCSAITSDPTDWARATDGLGADGVIDAAGVSATLKTAIDVVRPAGWITKVGWGKDPVGFSLDPVVQKNVRLQGSFSHNWPTWERAIRLLATGKLDLTPIVGGKWPLEQWQTAFETMHSGEIAKAVLTP